MEIATHVAVLKLRTLPSRDAGAMNRRTITASAMLLLGCALLVALIGDSSRTDGLLESAPYPHDDAHWLVGSGRAQLAAPAKQDEAAWRKTLVDYFGNWQSAIASNVNPSKDGYRGGGDGRVGAYKAPAAKSPEGELLPSAAATEAEWNKQISAMQDQQLSDNTAILNTVGSETWKARGQTQKWKPTVMLKRPRAGEFKRGELNSERVPAIGERGAAFLGLSSSLPPSKSTKLLPSPESGEFNNQQSLKALPAVGKRGAAFFGLEKGI